MGAFDWLFQSSTPQTSNWTGPYRAAPMDAYPTSQQGKDATNAGAFYGTPVDAYARGQVARVFAPNGAGPWVALGQPMGSLTNPGNVTTVSDFPPPLPKAADRDGIPRPLPRQTSLADNYARAGLAALSSPVAYIGYDPSRLAVDAVGGGDYNVMGVYAPRTDTMFSVVGPEADRASSMVHESVHRGIEKLRQDGKLPPLNAQGRTELPPDMEEVLVRAIMRQQMGNPEQGHYAQKAAEDANAKWYGAGFGRARGDITDYIKSVEDAAARYNYERKPRGGPR